MRVAENVASPGFNTLKQRPTQYFITKAKTSPIHGMKGSKNLGGGSVKYSNQPGHQHSMTGSGVHSSIDMTKRGGVQSDQYAANAR